MQLKGKVSVVTGAGRGVGRETAIELARAGSRVAINYRRNWSGANQVIEVIKQNGGDAIAFQADVRDDQQCRKLMNQAAEHFGSLDILVNNAGTTRFIDHADLDAVGMDDWDNLFATNVRAVFQCCRAAKPFLDRSRNGEIVNITSTAGIVATGSSIPYCASKAACINLTVTLARVFAPTIRVNSVAPGFIDGEWLKEGLGDEFAEAREDRARRNALQKVCQPSDIAQAVVSLIQGSDLVTGQTLVCDGGMIITPP